MNVSGLGIVHIIDNETDEIIGSRIKHNTNTQFGKQLVLLKLNENGIGNFSPELPSIIAGSREIINSYQVMLFAVGATAGAATGDDTLTSLIDLIPIKLKDDATATAGVYFQPTAADTDPNYNLITDDNFSVYCSDTHDDFYWKLIDSTTYEGSDSIKYVLRLESTDVASANENDTTISINEFGLYACPTQVEEDGSITIKSDTPKILFARLVESYDKTASMGIILEWIVTVT